MRYKVIIGDSSLSALEALRMALVDLGFDVYTFSNGNELTASIPHVDPDAFVLGISLEEKGGFEVGEYIAESSDYGNIPIIFLIGAFEGLDEEKISRIPHHGLFREPFDSGEVARSVKSLMEQEKGMDTLPEEPSFDEIVDMERKIQKQLDAAEKNMNSKIRNIVKKEIYEAAKELEKRVKAGVIREIKKNPDN